MLSPENNELMTRVGPGTPMGQLLRRFWVPALLSDELPEPNCDPVRVRLLGENFVAWRDASGTVGIFDEYCPHRGASLALGRCEGDGIRCIYHGWKFGTNGKILEVPNDTRPSIKERLNATVFPSVEAGEIIWVYLGPKEKRPALPKLPFMEVPPEHRFLTRATLNANWVQSMEGHLDSSHAGILHEDWDPFGKKGDDDYRQIIRADAPLYSQDDAPVIEVEDTIFGFHMSATRNAEQNGKPVKYARIHSYALPWMCIVPPKTHTFEIPIDDEHVSVILAISDPDKKVDRAAIEKVYGAEEMYRVKGPSLIKHFTGNAHNRWHQDRNRMRQNGSFSGIPGFLAEDFSVVASMGPIFDRSKEHLLFADAGVIRMRRLLIKAAKDLQQGIEPRMLTPEEWFRSEAGDGILEPGQRWQQLVPKNEALPSPR